MVGKGSEIGDYLTTHPLVNCISFTGGDTGMQMALSCTPECPAESLAVAHMANIWNIRGHLNHCACRHCHLQEGLHGPDPGSLLSLSSGIEGALAVSLAAYAAYSPLIVSPI